MPRTNRISCAGYDKQIDGNYMNVCSNNLLRLFLSARCLKKVSSLDAVCRKCRWKFDNWIMKTKQDFDEYIGPDGIMKIMDEEMVEIGVQADGEMGTIEIPISRTSASHRTCVVCKKNDVASSKVLSKEQQKMVFVKRGIVVPSGTRCCRRHLYNNHLTYDALREITPAKVVPSKI